MISQTWVKFERLKVILNNTFPANIICCSGNCRRSRFSFYSFWNATDQTKERVLEKNFKCSALLLLNIIIWRFLCVRGVWGGWVCGGVWGGWGCGGVCMYVNESKFMYHPVLLEILRKCVGLHPFSLILQVAMGCCKIIFLSVILVWVATCVILRAFGLIC